MSKHHPPWITKTKYCRELLVKDKTDTKDLSSSSVPKNKSNIKPKGKQKTFADIVKQIPRSEQKIEPVSIVIAGQTIRAK